MLEKKSLFEIRGIAQSFGVNDIFEKDKTALIQEIQLKQDNLTPEKPKPIEIPKYDASLMTKAPAEMASPKEIVRILEQHIKQGLKLNLTDERWYMSFRNKTDEGTMRMPLNHVLRCANNLLK